MLKNALPKIITETLPGPKSQALIDRRKEAIPSAIKCVYPVTIKRGEGAMLEDEDGNIFLDWVGGVGVLNMGYSHPEIIDAVTQQTNKYFHEMINIVTHNGYIELAEKMNSIVPVRGNGKKTFFANSGAEAIENAIKIAKAYTKRPNIIVFSGGFHGRTLLTMSMTSKKAYSNGLGPFPDGVYRGEFPYLYRMPKGMKTEDATDYYISKLLQVFEESSPAEQVAAMVVEPLQGEGGFIPVPFEWIKAVREICDRFGILLIADEVQTGFCRTGKMFASDYWKEFGAAPDIITSAKSIAAGLPISAITASSQIMDRVKPGTIGGTYCGNPLACASALKTIEIMERDNLATRSAEIGEKVMSFYYELKKKYDVIGDIRGLGAMIGMEFVKDSITKEPFPELVYQMVSHAANLGLIIESAGVYGNVIRFLAPLVITEEQLDAGLSIFEESLILALKDC